MMTFLQQADAAAAAPEILLAVLAMVLLMLGVFSRREAYGIVASGAVIALLVLGPERGPALARRLGIAALFLVHRRHGLETITTGRFPAAQ